MAVASLNCEVNTNLTLILIIILIIGSILMLLLAKEDNKSLCRFQWAVVAIHYRRTNSNTYV